MTFDGCNTNIIMCFRTEPLPIPTPGWVLLNFVSDTLFSASWVRVTRTNPKPSNTFRAVCEQSRFLPCFLSFFLVGWVGLGGVTCDG